MDTQQFSTELPLGHGRHKKEMKDFLKLNEN